MGGKKHGRTAVGFGKWSKGQEEAPMELLIAITLLTFVLILGLAVYQNMCRTQFEQKMKSSIHTFVTALESVYRGATGSSQQIFIDFSSEGCGGYDEIRIFEGSKTLCEKQIGLESCLAVASTVTSANKRETLVVEAMNIPTDSVTLEYRYTKQDGTSGVEYDWQELDKFYDEIDPLKPASIKGSHLFTIRKPDPTRIIISG